MTTAVTTANRDGDHIATQIRSIADRIDPDNEYDGYKRSTQSSKNKTVTDRLVAYVQARKSRDLLLHSLRFSDPAWDIILDMLICELSGRSVFVTDACIASNVPVSTALRWIALLETDGAIVKTPVERDKRRSQLQLSSEMKGKLLSWLSDHLDALPAS